MELPELNISNKSRTFDTYLKRDNAIKKIRVRATSGAANRRVLVVLGRKRKRIYRRFRESLYEGRVMNRRGITYFTRKRTMKDSTIVISLLVQY